MPEPETSLSAPSSTPARQLFSPFLRLALLLGVAVHLAGFLIFKIVSNPLPAYKDDGPYVSFVSSRASEPERDFLESAALLDSAPLFIPTRWNATRGEMDIPRLGEEAGFSSFGPRIDLADELRPSGLLVAVQHPVDHPEDLLEMDLKRVFVEYGRGGRRASPFPDPEPVARVEVLRPLFDGPSGAARHLEIEARDGSWPEQRPDRPVSLMVRVNGDGSPIGEPVVAESSGSAGFDEAARAWLVRSVRRGDLPHGFLQVTLFP